MSAHRLTTFEEWQLWWELHGELHFDVVTYYGMCAACGAVQGYLVGAQIIRLFQ